MQSFGFNGYLKEERGKMTKLYKVRKAKGIRQKELASRLQVAQSSISDREAKGIFKPATAQKYAKALGCSPCELLEGIDFPEKSTEGLKIHQLEQKNNSATNNIPTAPNDSELEILKRDAKLAQLHLQIAYLERKVKRLQELNFKEGERDEN